jgi:hypothetical protein
MRWCCSLILLALIAGPPLLAQPDEEGEPLEAVRVALGVEQTMLEANLREHQNLVLRREEAAARLTTLHKALDEAVADEKSANSGRLDLLIDQVVRVNGERDALFGSERALLERISDRRKRINLYAARISELEGREREEVQEGLTGTWDLVLMPIELRGTARLKQEGAVVTGTYEFSGGWTGSLQGTLVNRKVFLVRIDSQLGKMMEFEGYLSRDDQRIRGSWLNYEMSGAEGATGQWTAERRLEDD